MLDDLNDEQQLLLDATTRFIDEAYPLASLRASAFDDPDLASRYRRQAGDLGWFSFVVPDQHGGGSVSGNGVVDAALVAHQRGALLQPGAFVGTNVVAHSLGLCGSDEQRSTVLPALMAGEASAGWGFGVAPGLPATTGELRAATTGDGYRLTGRVTFVDDPGPGGWVLLTATSEVGLAQFLVPVDTPGLEVVALDGLDLSRRFVEVRLDDVGVPADCVVGHPGESDADVAAQLALACVLTTAESVGAMTHEFEMTVQYAKDRIAFGRPIGSFQAIKHVLADTSLNLEMSKAITLVAARYLGEADPYGAQAASMAKAFVGDCGVDLAQHCFQIFGGIGFTWEHDQHLYLRRLSTDSVRYGDPTWHREHHCRLAGI